MANINLRLYGEQIYPNITKYLTKYISPEITKDDFISMYKNGHVELKQISLKESLPIFPQIEIEEAKISLLEINIPDEKENFSISISDAECLITISEISENEIEKLLIEEKKKLIDEFINYSFKKVLKKDGASFIDNLIKNVVEKIINGMTFDVKNLELKIRAKNRDNIYFILLIEDANYSIDKGIIIKNMSLVYQDDLNKINILEKFSINVDIKSAEEKETQNKIDINLSDANFTLNKNIYLELTKILDMFEETKYKKIYIKYKKLIQYHNSKNKENNKEDYISELTDVNQIEIVQNYLENNTLVDDIILTEDNNALKASKLSVEKKILDDKNSNVLANAFSFFFGGNKEEKKNELSEEEKNSIEEIYQDENINKYLNNEIKTSNNFDIIFDKIKSFLSNISLNFELSKLQLNLLNENKIYDFNFFINSMKFNLNYIEKQFDFNFIINDIGYKNDDSFLKKRNSQNAIEINRDKNNFIEIKLGFENVEIKIDEFFGIFIFLNLIKKPKKQKIFHNKLNLNQENKRKENYNQIINNITNFSFVNNFKLSNIPSLSIWIKNYKLDINIFNYALTENSINFTININDSDGKILKDLSFNIIKNEKDISCEIESPIELNIKSDILLNIIMHYFEYIKEISKQQIKNDFTEKEDYLVELNNVANKNIEFGNIDFNEYTLNIIIKKIDLKIYKQNNILEKSFLLDDIKISYEKKNLNIEYNKCIITTDFKSNLFFFLLKSNLTSIENGNIKEKEKKIQTKTNNDNILKNVLNKFDIKGKTINILLNSGQLLVSINLNNINIYQEDNNQYVCLSIDNWNGNASLYSNNKNKNILKSDKKSLIKYDMISKMIKVELESIYLNASFQILNNIYDDFSFLFKENKDSLIPKNDELLKIELDLNNFAYEIENKYIFGISKISIKNFNENDNILSIFYINMNKLTVKNLNKSKIMFTEQLNIIFNLGFIEGTKMDVNCDEIFFNLSKNEFLFFYSVLKQSQKINYKKFYSYDMEQKYNNKKILLPGNNNLMEEIEKNKIPLKPKTTMQIVMNKKEKKSLDLNININKIELNLCKNDNYEKTIQLSMNYLSIKSIFNLKESISLDNNYNQYLSVQGLNLIYYDNDKETYNLLTKRKEALNQKQLEIKYGNNSCEINITGNEINLRFDLFLILYYYFEDNDSLKKSYMSINEAIEIKKCIKLCFNDSKFQLSTSFEGKENLFLDINNFIVIYNNTNCKFPYGTYDMLLDKLSSNIILKNTTRKLFKTGDNFLSINLNLYEDLITMNITIGSLLINLSYRDFVSFLRAYQLNLKLINSAMKNKENLTYSEDNEYEIKVEKGETPDSYKKNGKIYAGKITLSKSINLKLIDDSKGTYQPFLNFVLENFSLDFDPENTFISKFYFGISSYNYIACVWEPVIEKLLIKSNGAFKDIYEIKIDMDSLLINLSDMAISFTLITFDNWLTKLELKTKKYENKEIKLNHKQNTGEGKEFKNIKISNNQIFNCTGIELKILHNGKQIICPPLQKMDLDNSDLDEIDEMKKLKNITLLYDNEHKFEIPLKKILNLEHKINDKLFIISENSLSENKTINISLYSPIIIRNKTSFPLKIQFSNNKGLSEIFLVSNSICGVPLNLITLNSYFCFYLLESGEYSDKNRSDDFNISKLININEQYMSKVEFLNKTFSMKLVKKLNRLRVLTLYSQYNIINCLPCEIEVEYLNKSCKIEKCSQHYITENCQNNLSIVLSIETNYGKFSTDRIALFDNKYKTNFLTFRNMNRGKIFKLPCMFKENEEEKMLIIYSELILHNRSGLNINIDSSDGDYLICFCVKDNINLISSNIDYKDEKLIFRCNKYFSKSIKIHKLIQITNNMTINMMDSDSYFPFDIIIKKKSSLLKIENNPNFKEKIISIVFSIFPMCRIFNLLSTKRFIIFDYESLNKSNIFMIIEPFQTTYFYFFNKRQNVSLGIAAVNLNAKLNLNSLVRINFKIGIYTLMTDDFIYSLDIKKNPTSGCWDVYILENDINNSQTIIENLSNEGITIYQEGYEKNLQIVYPNELVPLKIYNFYNKTFFIITVNSKKEINLKQMKNHQKDKYGKSIIQLNSQCILIIQDNGIKMKMTFYSLERYAKAESNIIKINYRIFIKSIYISVIGDNEIENPKLTEYKRYELLLIYLTNFYMEIEQISGLLDRNLIKTKLVCDKLRIYNQLNSQFKFTCILKNAIIPCLKIENEINYYRKQKIININRQKIYVQKLALGIDPDFFRIFLRFYDNVLYRMDLTYRNINKIFKNKEVFDPKKLIKKHRKGRILINAIELTYPELQVEYELVEKNLDTLLKERIACSDFYIWAAKGLVGSVQELTLDNFIANYTNGTIVNYFIWLYYLYENKIEDNLTEVGVQGILGQFKNFLFFDLYNEEEKNKYAQKNRLREIRPFYGKFKFFREYDGTDAILIKKTLSKNKSDMMGQYYPIKIIKDKESFYFFTNFTMFNIKSLNYNIKWYIDYFTIKNAEAVDDRVKVFYNQKINNYESCSFKCENNKTAKEVVETLKEEALKSKDNTYEI